jgi:molybdopterin-guanine dinucleotide biosynthesis protein A
VGYAGFLKKQLDWELLLALATRRPDWSFVFVGARRPHPEIAPLLERLAALPNAHFLGAKPTAELAGRPLIAHVLAATRAAGLETIVVAKPSTDLPDLDVEVLLEPESPFHPLLGIVAGLRWAEAVLAVPCDMPFLSVELLRWLSLADDDCVVGVLADNGIQPFPALYRAATLPVLERALRDQRSLRAALRGAGASTFELARFGDPERLTFTVNTPTDLARAELLLRVDDDLPSAS